MKFIARSGEYVERRITNFEHQRTDLTLFWQIMMNEKLLKMTTMPEKKWSTKFVLGNDLLMFKYISVLQEPLTKLKDKSPSHSKHKSHWINSRTNVSAF